MPVCLYYKVFDKEALLEQLKHLQCVSWESEDRFFINYFKEAKMIGLTTKYNQVPKDVYPVILGHGHIVDETHLHLDLRSFERGVRMVEFIDKWISPIVARVKHVACYNKISITHEDNFEYLESLDFDELFSDDNMVILDQRAKVQKLDSVMEAVDSEEEKIENLVDLLDEVVNEDFVLVEKFPLYYYEDGIDSIDHALKFRMLVAIERWHGNTDCKPIDVFQKKFLEMMNSEDESWH